MRFNCALAAGIALAALAVQPALAEQSFSWSEGVLVFRGSAEMYVEEAPAPSPAPRQIIEGGANLWIYDPQTGEVTFCDSLNNVYGHPVVRCSTN